MKATTIDSDTARATSLFVQRIASQYDMAGAVLFGSRARQTHRPDSDADVLVLLRGAHRKRPAVPPCRIVIYGLSGRSGKSSSIRLLGQTGNFSRVSFSQACGSSPFSLAVPNRL